MSAIFTPKDWDDLSVTDQKWGYAYRENYDAVMAERKQGYEDYTRGKTKEEFLALGEPALETLQDAAFWGFTVEWVDD